MGWVTQHSSAKKQWHLLQTVRPLEYEFLGCAVRFTIPCKKSETFSLVGLTELVVRGTLPPIPFLIANKSGCYPLATAFVCNLG